MSTNQGPSSGRRQGRGGQRRQRGGRSDDSRSTYRPQGQPNRDTEPAPEPKPGLLKKVLGLFGLGKKPAAPARGTSEREPSPREGSGRAPGRGASTVSSNYPTAPARETREPREAREPRENREPREAREPSSRPARKPEAIEVTTPKVYLGNLSFDATESDLAELFAGAGSVRNVEIITFRETMKSKGFGFVTMASVEEAKRAVDELHDKEFMGRKLVVSGAKTPVERA